MLQLYYDKYIDDLCQWNTKVDHSKYLHWNNSQTIKLYYASWENDSKILLWKVEFTVVLSNVFLLFKNYVEKCVLFGIINKLQLLKYRERVPNGHGFSPTLWSIYGSSKKFLPGVGKMPARARMLDAEHEFLSPNGQIHVGKNCVKQHAPITSVLWEG